MKVVLLYVDEDASDTEQLEFATEQGRVIYTFNAGDFARLHREFLQQGRPHAGIVVIPEQCYSIGQKVRRLAAFVQATSAESMANRIEFL